MPHDLGIGRRRGLALKQLLIGHAQDAVQQGGQPHQRCTHQLLARQRGARGRAAVVGGGGAEQEGRGGAHGEAQAHKGDACQLAARQAAAQHPARQRRRENLAHPRQQQVGQGGAAGEEAQAVQRVGGGVQQADGRHQAALGGGGRRPHAARPPQRRAHQRGRELDGRDDVGLGGGEAGVCDELHAHRKAVELRNARPDRQPELPAPTWEMMFSTTPEQRYDKGVARPMAAALLTVDAVSQGECLACSFTHREAQSSEEQHRRGGSGGAVAAAAAKPAVQCGGDAGGGLLLVCSHMRG